MTDTVKDLDYYMANPHEMPDDFVAKQLGESTEEEVSAASSAEPEVEDESTPEKVEAKAEEPELKEAEPEGIASKNGKHILPYSALATERERRQSAERAMAELAQRIQALEGSKQAAPVAEAPSEENGEDLEAIMSDFPTLAGPIKALLSKVNQLEGQLNTVAQREQQREQQDEQARTLTVQEAIEANPTLFYWQNANEEMFKAAVAFDDQIKADPRNQSLSLEDRFSRVVAAVEAVYGKTELPPEYRKDEPKSESLDTLAGKAKEKIEQAVRKSSPKTLSDLPGGIPPESSKDEQMGNMSPTELGAMMMKMSPQQVAELLTRVG